MYDGVSMGCLKDDNIEFLVRLSNVTVEIPLRGLRKQPSTPDPRIILKKNGQYLLRALDNISLTLKRGERIGIIGGNGQGKTTLLKLIGGILPASAGQVEVRGSIRALLTMDAGIAPALTGLQNIKLHYYLLKIRALSLNDYIEDVAAFANLGAFLAMPIGTYSPGMRSRLRFAMNTVEPADILLLDEWIGLADKEFQEKANLRLINFINKNEGFFLVSHNEQLVERMTDRQIQLELGKIIGVNE